MYRPRTAPLLAGAGAALDIVPTTLHSSCLYIGSSSAHRNRRSAAKSRHTAGESRCGRAWRLPLKTMKRLILSVYASRCGYVIGAAPPIADVRMNRKRPVQQCVVWEDPSAIGQVGPRSGSFPMTLSGFYLSRNG